MRESLQKKALRAALQQVSSDTLQNYTTVYDKCITTEVLRSMTLYISMLSNCVMLYVCRATLYVLLHHQPPWLLVHNLVLCYILTSLRERGPYNKIDYHSATLCRRYHIEPKNHVASCSIYNESLIQYLLIDTL
jgi:hypothetical protein